MLKGSGASESQARDLEMKRDERKRKWHVCVYRTVAPVLGTITKRLFNYTYDTEGADEIEGPVLVIPNHSCAWDPILVAAAFRKKQMYFVASEHILRWKVIGPLINVLVEPIPRKKAGAATGTVMACLRHLKAGHSVAIFAEGEQTWDGVTGKIFPSTGKLIKQSGATLVTFRLEGAYISLPRWAKGIRKGRVFGHTVNIYSPETLKGMTSDEVVQAVNDDIYYDVWKWQDEQPGGRVSFRMRGKGKEPAKGLEKALFICPGCGKMGNLSTSGDSITCTCGFRARLSDTGFIECAAGTCRIKTIHDWEEWQAAEFERQFTELDRSTDKELFKDGEVALSLVRDGHSDTEVGTGALGAKLEKGRIFLTIGERGFDLADINTMALVLSNIMLFRTEDSYYQIKAENTNLRKYLMIWRGNGLFSS